MRFSKNEMTDEPEFKPHPKYVAGHVYRRTQGTKHDLYFAGKSSDSDAVLWSLGNGNVWCTGELAPFGDQGRVVQWEDVTHMVHIDCSNL